MKKPLALLLTCLFVCSLFSCAKKQTEPPAKENEEEAARPAGWYLPQGEAAGDLINAICVTGDTAVWYKVDLTGRTETTYACSFAEGKLHLTGSGEPITMTYNAKNDALVQNVRTNGAARQTVFQGCADYILPTDTGDAAFTAELFGEDKSENYYNYAPAVLCEGADTLHVWYCANVQSGDVTDHIVYRRGTLHADGKWSFSAKAIALSPGAEGAWDARHVCDPAVVKGTFRYQGEDYAYLMAYLGCKTDDSTANEVGLALAKAPAGPWIKCGDPVADFYRSDEYDAALWGYGQPALVSADRAGKVFLFYTKGVAAGTFTAVELWNFADMDAPEKLREGTLPDAAGIINNADFAYNAAQNVFYCLKENHGANEWYPTDGGVDWLGGSVSLLIFSPAARDAALTKWLFETPTATVGGAIDTAATGYARNHNAALVTDEYGQIIEADTVPVIFTASDLAADYPDWTAGGQWPALHTYRLHGYLLPAVR